MTYPDAWHSGNAKHEGDSSRGWFVGRFIEPAGIRSSEDVEMKWGIHRAGEHRESWASDERRTTVVLLIKGHFRVDLSTGSVVLDTEGDYAMWGPGVDHAWEALEESVVITVRWPSIS